MAVQLGALRDALMHPGDEVKASRAAEEVASYESQFTAIKIDLALVKWMLALVIGGTVSLVIKAFT